MSRYISVNGTGKNQSFTDDDLPLSVGEERISDIPVQGCIGSAGHIGDADGHLFFQPVLSTVPVFHNNSEISSSVWLKSGDIIQICSSSYKFTVAGDHYTFLHSSISEQGSSSDHNSRQHLSNTTSNATVLVSEPDIPMATTAPRNLSSRGKWLALSVTVLSLLLIVSIFILFARPVHIQVTPHPDKLSLSGFPPAITLGNRFLTLPGTYTIVAAKTGYLTMEEDVEVVSDGKNEFSINLLKLPGKLQLKTSPKMDVTVFVDDNKAGVTPLASLEIAAGRHQIKFEKERYLPNIQEIEIAGMSQVQKLEVNLLPAWSVFTLNSDPAEATVSIDGDEYGTTPANIEILQGYHKIEFKKKGFKTEEISVESTAGQNQNVDIRLTPSSATITAKSSPKGTSLLVDNQFRGVTPLTIELSSGEQHVFTIQAAGYTEVEKSYIFEPDEQRQLNFTLTPEYGTVFFQIEPPTATLIIDGKRQKNSNGRFKLPTKKTKIEVQHSGYKSYHSNLLPTKSYSQNISVNLVPLGRNSTLSAAPPKVTKTKTGGKLLLISPSRFTMGAPRREAGRRANEHEHQVVLKRPFYASSNLVTNKEYRQFRPNHSSGAVAGHSLAGEKQPVVNVTWKDAILYLNWLSEQQGLLPFYRINKESIEPATPINNGYRLLTEAEWAYIARKAKRTHNDRYPWPGTYPPHQPVGNYGDASSSSFLPLTISGYNDSFPVSSPVGSFSPNPAGFFDLGGNVAEWCHDYYTAYNSTKEADPLGPSSGTLYVIRGSGWRDSSVAELRLSYRGYHNKAQDDVGFRIARYAQ